jgi:hypothetical protein
VNRGVPLHLLTRHARDPQTTLTQHRLGGLFDEIIHLKEGQKKSSAVTRRPAVFIDDSYAERSEVSIALGIPAFGPESVEALITCQNKSHFYAGHATAPTNINAGTLHENLAYLRPSL